jgi:hypothetical protein
MTIQYFENEVGVLGGGGFERLMHLGSHRYGGRRTQFLLEKKIKKIQTCKC